MILSECVSGGCYDSCRCCRLLYLIVVIQQSGVGCSFHNYYYIIVWLQQLHSVALFTAVDVDLVVIYILFIILRGALVNRTKYYRKKIAKYRGFGVYRRFYLIRPPRNRSSWLLLLLLLLLLLSLLLLFAVVFTSPHA